MNKRLLSILQYIIFLGAGIFLIWWQFKDMSAGDRADFYKSFQKANYWLIIPIVFMSLLSHLIRAIRWKYLMEPLDYKPALKNVFAVTMIGYLANSAIPRLGEILKCSFLAKYENLKFEKLVGTIILERAFDLICFIIFISITIIIQVDVVGFYVKAKLIEIGRTSGMPVWAKVLVALLILTAIVYGIKFLFKKYPNNKIINKISAFIKGMAEGFTTIKHLKKKKLFLISTLAIWLLYLLQIYIGFSAMEGTSNLTIKAACAVLTLATLAMIATPGGIGSFPFFVMETLVIYGIANPLGYSFGWLIWGVATGIIVIVGLVCLLIIPYLNKNNHEVSKQHT